jgi:hypothetical protein
MPMPKRGDVWTVRFDTWTILLPPLLRASAPHNEGRKWVRTIFEKSF